MLKHNLSIILNQATASELNHAANWYREARLFCYNISDLYGVSFKKTCAIMAAMSPRNKWERNKTDTENFVKFKLGLTEENIFATYGKMVGKAHSIFDADTDSVNEMLRLLNGPKISAFFLNIYDVENNGVTVDTWIHLAALNQYIPIDKRPSLSKADYNAISDAIKELASENAMTAPSAQAAIWLAFKRLTEEGQYGYTIGF